MYSKYLENIFRGEEFPLMFSGYNSYNKIKGENDMFDVSKIKLGDYVETRDGRIGYVVENKWSIGENRFAVQFNNGDIYSFLVCTITNKYFKQIGTYKFDEEEKKDKCDIKYCSDFAVKSGYEHDYTTIQDSVYAFNYLKDKINEIIDYLNKE